MSRCSSSTRFLALALAISCLHASVAFSPAADTKLVLVLEGDSITDNGNVFKLLGAPNPKFYFPGRFTNGPNWVDYLTDAVSKFVKNVTVHNYAYGGATACANNETATIVPVIKDLGNQTAAFLADAAAGKVPKPSADTRVVLIQWVGSNDIDGALRQLAAAQAAAAATNSTPPDLQTAGLALATAIVTCRLAAAQAVAASGAVSDIVLLPISPLYQAPAVPSEYRMAVTLLVSGIDGALAGQVKTLSGTFSSALKTRLHWAGDSSWIDKLSTTIVPPFKNTTYPCLWNPRSVLEILDNLTLCTDVEDRYFFDQIHPTTRFHKHVALKGILPRLQQLKGAVPRRVAFNRFIM
ncbi:hypothetical protein CHLRE_16g680300v5 [Chlamydomonas reinhardtii]|uniref:Uncharacterized protein n=1 Tax=Chlamydomonas reinhardtii TaxID=3055 RepID=A8J3V5_CHLRE|nr:uncharacterized protein CHLRE_16g680300v5 [Chlamydomonas reinhardtii]PNW72152.1 hypothetical protein CHLRE_16g680300v5 [Chlamydomonas reinhardtii]|eukprot:XP_001695883.1 predicted protein [Chlamydomonas reinhardtii]